MKKLLFFILLISTFFTAKATHLVGGEMSYVRLGGNTIRVTLKVYRDNINGQAAFDGDNNSPNPADCIISFYNDSGTFLEAIEIDLDNILTLVIEPEPCQDVLPGIETQEGTYTFDVNLNNINGYNPLNGVTLVYGRCCRNGNLISNLTNAGQQGFSSIVRVPPAAMINSSPSFNAFDQYLCAARYNQLDFSASDPDGDSLYYFLCDPYLGLDDNDPAANEFNLNSGGTYPNYGPPYNTVIWGPGFSATNPLGGTMALNGNTGIMGATPPNQGVYVMGVCVSEYRNGVLLSTISRDFQYLVSACDFPDITIATDPNIPQDPNTGLFTIDADCNEGVVNFSLANDIDIDSYLWDFGDPNNPGASTSPNPSFFYADTGTYVVTVIGFAADGCADTSQGLVIFYPIFEPGYMFQDSCLNQDVVFTDTSFATTGNLNSWTWDFGDPGTTTDTSLLRFPSYQYTTAGTFTASLIVTTDKGCIDTVFNDITIHPLPEPSFTTSDPQCEGVAITLTNTSAIQSGTIDNYSWEVDGNSYSTPNVNYTFATDGTYPVSLIEISDLGCTDTLVQNVVVNPSPTVNIIGNSPICPNTSMQLTATGGVSYAWEANTLLSATNIPNPMANMQTTPDTFFVQVTDANQCMNTDSIFIDLFALPPAEAGMDTSVCLNVANVVSFNTTVPLQASGGVSYVWSPPTGLTTTNSANTVASPSNTTTYTVTVTDANNCVNTDSVKVVVLNPALELISVEVDSLCLGDTVVVDVLDLGNVTSYTWFPNVFITDNTVREPGFYPPTTRDYRLETVNYCYLDRDTITIEVIASPPIDAGPLDSICLGDPAYQLNAQPDSLDFYQWTTTDPSISDNSIPNPLIQPIVNTWYYIYAVDTVGSLACESNDSVLIEVNNVPDLSLSYPVGYPGYVCLGDAINLTAVSFDATEFAWSSNNGATIVSPSSDITQVVPADTTTFYQTVTNVHGCTRTDSIDVDVQLPVVAGVLGDTIMCVGSYVDLEGTGGLYYEWAPDSIFSNVNSNLTQASPDSSITVTVYVSNDCFSDSADHNIQVNQLPLVDAGPDITIFRDETGFLNGAGTGEPLWYAEDKTFAGIIDPPNFFGPEVSPFSTTNYVLEITDTLTGCLNYDTAIVNVDVLTLLAFPTAFSPNGNGVNDFAGIIKYLNIEKLVYLSIYDRWGEEIYRSEELNAVGWDGTYRGMDVEIGVYMWMIRAITKDQEAITRKGNITVIR